MQCPSCCEDYATWYPTHHFVLHCPRVLEVHTDQEAVIHEMWEDMWV